MAKAKREPAIFTVSSKDLGNKLGAKEVYLDDSIPKKFIAGKDPTRLRTFRTQYFDVKLTKFELDAILWAVGNFTQDHLSVCDPERWKALRRVERKIEEQVKEQRHAKTR